MVVIPTGSWALIWAWARWAVALGAGTGLLVGCIEGRAVERALTAERTALQTEHLEEQRDYLDYLNGILRHEVLNTATIINATRRGFSRRSPRWTTGAVVGSRSSSTRSRPCRR